MRSNEYLRSEAAQTYLAGLGFYLGAIDGAWGPLSTAAARAWDAARNFRAGISDKPGKILTPYEVAKQHLGTREIPGKTHNPVIVRWLRAMATWINDDETAWCSAFVAFCASEAAYETEGATLAARSWLNVGEKIHVADARAGDVVVFWRGSPTAWTGHVAFVSFVDRNVGTVRVVGGNQSDSVSLASYQLSTVLGFRRLRSLDFLQGSSNKI